MSPPPFSFLLAPSPATLPSQAAHLHASGAPPAAHAPSGGSEGHYAVLAKQLQAINTALSDDLSQSVLVASQQRATKEALARRIAELEAELAAARAGGGGSAS